MSNILSTRIPFFVNCFVNSITISVLSKGNVFARQGIPSYQVSRKMINGPNVDVDRSLKRYIKLVKSKTAMYNHGLSLTLPFMSGKSLNRNVSMPFY